MPDAVLVLVDPVEALGNNTAVSQLRERLHDVADLPAQEGKRLRLQMFDVGHAKSRLADAKHAGNNCVVQELEPKDVFVERMRPIKIDCGNETDMAAAGEQLRRTYCRGRAPDLVRRAIVQRPGSGRFAAP